MAGPLIHRRVKVVSVQWTNEITIHNEQHPKSRAQKKSHQTQTMKD